MSAFPVAYIQVGDTICTLKDSFLWHFWTDSLLFCWYPKEKSVILTVKKVDGSNPSSYSCISLNIEICTDLCGTFCLFPNRLIFNGQRGFRKNHNTLLAIVVIPGSSDLCNYISISLHIVFCAHLWSTFQAISKQTYFLMVNVISETITTRH